MNKTLYKNLSGGWRHRWQKIGWCLRQLVPTTYRTRYKDGDNAMHFCVWRMWLGRSYKIDDVVVQA